MPFNPQFPFGMPWDPGFRSTPDMKPGGRDPNLSPFLPNPGGINPPPVNPEWPWMIPDDSPFSPGRPAGNPGGGVFVPDFGPGVYNPYLIDPTPPGYPGTPFYGPPAPPWVNPRHQPKSFPPPQWPDLM